MAKTRRQKQERRKVSAKKVAESRKRGGGGSSYLRVPEGMSFFKFDNDCIKRIDILDYIVGDINPNADEPGMLHYELSYLLHAGIGFDGKGMYICPKTVKKRCPICDHRAELIKQGADPKEDQVVRGLRPKERQLFLLYDLDDMEKGVQIWDFSYYNFGEMLNDRVDASDDDDGYEYFSSHDESGMTLKVAFQEKQIGTIKFPKATSIDFKARKKPYPDDLIDQLPCLDDMLVVESYEKLKKILFEGEDAPEEDEKDVEDATPDDDDDEVEDDQEDEQDDDEDDEEEKETPWTDDEDDKDEVGNGKPKEKKKEKEKGKKEEKTKAKAAVKDEDDDEGDGVDWDDWEDEDDE